MTFTSLPIKHLCCFVSDDFSTKIGECRHRITRTLGPHSRRFSGYSQGNRLILRSSDSKGVVDQEILGDEQLIINGFELVTEPVKQIVCYGGNLFQVFPMIEDRKQSSPTV